MNPSCFFVNRNLLADDSPVLEIQMLRDDYATISLVMIPSDTTHMRIDDFVIPPAVLDAARRCDATGGNYVDASGAVLPPF